MNTIRLLIFLICLPIQLFSQLEASPSVVILTCEKWSVDPKIPFDVASRVQDFNYLEYENRILKGYEFNLHTEFVQQSIMSELGYLKDFSLKEVPSDYFFNFLLPLFKVERNMLVKLSNNSLSPEKNSYKSIAGSEKVQYVLNIAEVRVSQSESGNQLELRVELYDTLSDTIIFKAIGKGITYYVEEGYGGCDGDIQCLVSQAVDDIGFDLREVIINNTEKGIRNRDLYEKRKGVWLQTLQESNDDSSFLEKVLEENEVEFEYDPKEAFHVICNSDKTMFKALFLNELTRSETNEGLYLDECDCPNGNGYEITELSGFMFDNNWYLNSDFSFYCNAFSSEAAKLGYVKKLINNNYFKENSVERSDDFWKNEHFERVESEVERQQDLIRILKIRIDDTKNPGVKKELEQDIKSYYQIDEENKEYIGMFSLIADIKIAERDERERTYNEELTKAVVIPFFDKLQKENPKVKFKFSLGFDHKTIFIFPPDTSIILLPVVVHQENGTKTMRMYAMLPNQDGIGFSMYHWTFFKELTISDSYFHDYLLDFMNVHTTWELRYRFLNDPDFWATKVLFKENDKYKYLFKIEY